MTWDAAASVGRFDDAVDWFLLRQVITGEQGRGIEADGQARSFWVGAGLQLDQIQRVFDSLEEAQSKGTPFEDWRKGIRETLKSPAHAEVVFRNANQRAYNAGRWAQMTDPDVLEFRPYWMYDAILDSRTTKICRPRHETVLLAEDPWWQNNWPPLHHNCRSSVRSLTEEQAEARGIANAPPEADDNQGWGHAPINDEPWAPPRGKHDPRLRAEAERKRTALSPRQKRPQDAEAQRWVKEYSRYGEAAEAIAWGRAAYQRGLDMTVREAREALQGAVNGRLSLELRDPAIQDKTLREAGAELTPVLGGLAAMAGHAKSITKRPRWLRSDVNDEQGQAGLEFFSAMTDESVRLPGDRLGGRLSDENNRLDQYSFSLAGERARQRDGDFVEYHSTSTFVHEVGHSIEYLNAKAMRAAYRFLTVRTSGETAERLNRLTSTSYGDDEIAKPDGFSDPYVGKIYEETFYRPHPPTEVISMGIDRLTTYAGLRGAMARDREHVFFSLGILAGR